MQLSFKLWHTHSNWEFITTHHVYYYYFLLLFKEKMKTCTCGKTALSNDIYDDKQS